MGQGGRTRPRRLAQRRAGATPRGGYIHGATLTGSSRSNTQCSGHAGAHGPPAILATSPGTCWTQRRPHPWPTTHVCADRRRLMLIYRVITSRSRDNDNNIFEINVLDRELEKNIAILVYKRYFQRKIPCDVRINLRQPPCDRRDRPVGFAGQLRKAWGLAALVL